MLMLLHTSRSGLDYCAVTFSLLQTDSDDFVLRGRQRENTTFLFKAAGPD